MILAPMPMMAYAMMAVRDLLSAYAIVELIAVTVESARRA